MRARLSKSKLFSLVVRDIIFTERTSRYIRCKLFDKNRYKKLLQKPPRLLGFNITGFCNAKCCYCAYRFHKPDGCMDIEIYKKALTDFSSMGGGEIGFSTLTGEPLLDPLIMQRIEIASQFFNIKSILIETNGILFKKEEIVNNLVRLSGSIKMDIGISLPGFEREVFKRVYQANNYENVLYGINNLLQACRDNENININLHLQPDRGGVLQDDDFKNMILPYINLEDVYVAPLIRDNWCGQIKQEHLTGELILHRPLIFKNFPCFQVLRGHIDILVNGDVRLCGCRYGSKGKNDSLVIGNIMEESLSDIWYGEKRKAICEQFLSGNVPEACKECLLYEPFINEDGSSMMVDMYRRVKKLVKV